MKKDCPFCALARGDLIEHRSRWFYVGPEGAVVEDLDPKGAALRLLFAPVVHAECGKESRISRNIAATLLAGIGAALAVEEGLLPGRLDLDDHDFRAHWHAQLSLRRPEW